MANGKTRSCVGYNEGYDDGVNNARTDILAALTLFGVPDDLLYYLGYDSKSIEAAKKDIKAELHKIFLESDDSCMAYPYVRLRTMLDIFYCLLSSGIEPSLIEKAGFSKEIIACALSMNKCENDVKSISLSDVD